MAKVRKIDGAWYMDYDDALGRRKRVRAKVQTKRWANEELRRRLDLAARGILDDGGTTFESYAKAWLKRRRTKIRPRTWETYEGQVRNHLLDPKLRLGRLPLSKISLPVCRDFQANLVKTRELAPRTLNAITTLLGTILQAAVEDGYLVRNPVPDVEREKQEEEEMDYLRAHEVGQVLLAAPGISPQAHLAVLVSITAGLRRGELLALRWMDFDRKGRALQVRRSYVGGQFHPPKTKKSRRRVPIPEQTMMTLLESRMYLGNPDGEALIFDRGNGKPLDPDTLSKITWPKVLRAAGLRESLRWHDLRHTYASLLLLQGENLKTIQELMGHSSITVTMDRYAHLSPAAAQEAADRLSETLGLDPAKSQEGAQGDP